MDFYPLGSLRNQAHRLQTGYPRRLRHSCLVHGARDGDAKQQQQRQLLLPEAFLPHVLLALVSALTHLATGHRTEQASGAVCGVRGWRPLLHRAVAAHNVLLRWPDGADFGAAVYPEVALNNFGRAVAANDLARELERVRCAGQNVPQEEKPQHQPVDWSPDDLQGRTNVRGSGEIVRGLCCGNVQLYSQQLRDALDLATTADQANGPTARELLKTLVRLRGKVNPSFVAVQMWVWDRYLERYIPDDATKPKGPGEFEGNDGIRFGDKIEVREKRGNENSGARTGGDKPGGEAEDGGEADHGKTGRDKEKDHDDNGHKVTNDILENEEKEGNDSERDDTEDNKRASEKKTDDDSSDVSEEDENFIKTQEQVEEEEDEKADDVVDIEITDGTTERIYRKRQIHTVRQMTVEVKKRRL